MRLALLAMTTAALPVAASAATLVIDDFTTTQIVADNPVEPNFPSASEIAASEAIGGFRELRVETLLSGGPFASTLGANADGESLLSFSNASRQQGIGTVIYDGEGSAGLGGANLAIGDPSDGFTGFRFSLAEADFDLTVQLAVADTSGGSSMFEQTFGRELVGTTLDFPFARFTGDADFSSVDRIAFTFSGPQDLDASIGKIEVVAGDTPAPIPVPASALLLGTGLLGVAALRRRRKS